MLPGGNLYVYNKIQPKFLLLYLKINNKNRLIYKYSKCQMDKNEYKR